MSTADRVALPRFAVDLFATVAIDRLITDVSLDAIVVETINHESRNDLGETTGTPPATRKEPMVGRKIQWLDPCSQRQHRRDGSVTGEQNSGGAE